VVWIVLVGVNMLFCVIHNTFGTSPFLFGNSKWSGGFAVEWCEGMEVMSCCSVGSLPWMCLGLSVGFAAWWIFSVFVHRKLPRIVFCQDGYIVGSVLLLQVLLNKMGRVAVGSHLEFCGCFVVATICELGYCGTFCLKIYISGYFKCLPSACQVPIGFLMRYL